MNEELREVTERDLRSPEFREGSADEYEFRADGKIVRKDRFKRGIMDISTILFGARYAYEIPELVDAVRNLKAVPLENLIDDAREVFDKEPKAIECLDYLTELLRAEARK